MKITLGLLSHQEEVAGNQLAEVLADLDFANDIALLSDTLNQAQDLLCSRRK